MSSGPSAVQPSNANNAAVTTTNASVTSPYTANRIPWGQKRGMGGRVLEKLQMLSKSSAQDFIPVKGQAYTMTSSSSPPEADRLRGGTVEDTPKTKAKPAKRSKPFAFSAFFSKVNSYEFVIPQYRLSFSSVDMSLCVSSTVAVTCSCVRHKRGHTAKQRIFNLAALNTAMKSIDRCMTFLPGNFSCIQITAHHKSSHTAQMLAHEDTYIFYLNIDPHRESV